MSHDTYAVVADSYDIMIDWPERIARERPFFEALFRQTTIWQVLDVGAATGHHSRLFAELGAKVIGLDPSASMLQRARALTPGVNPFFVEGGFESIPRLKHQFDLITVLGNTLAHARDLPRLQQAAQAMYDALAPAGQLCLQVINYDKLLATGSHWMPPLSRHVDDHDYLFLREHRVVKDHVEFTLITVTHDSEWRQHVERCLHLPLPRRLLETTLQQAGFTRLECYGDYQCTPFDPDTAGALIVVAGR